MLVRDLISYEASRRAAGIKRGAMCEELGISQAKWRRMLEGAADAKVEDRTLALAMAAIVKGVQPYPYA